MEKKKQSVMENPSGDQTLKCKIERDLYSPWWSYVVNVGGIALDVTVVTWHHRADLKKWLRRVRRIYNPKNRKKCEIVVAINARDSHNFLGRGGRKDSHYELLQICVGQHCLLIKIEPGAAVPRSLKFFLRNFFDDRRFLFVGVGIKHIIAKLYKDYKYTNFKDMCMIQKPVDLTELAARGGQFDLKDGKKCSLEKLVNMVLGLDYERPKTMPWYGERWELSEELIMWSSVDVYLMAKIKMSLSS